MYRVLIVDDERLIREGLATLIPWEEHGFRVAGAASDGLEALQKVADGGFDLIIADIRMPRMDGLEFLEALRAQGLKLPFLILSGFAEFEYAQKAAGWGIAGYLLKPIDEVELVGHLARIRTELDETRFSVASLLQGRDRVPEPWNWGRWQVLLCAPLSSSGQSVFLDASTQDRFRTLIADREGGESFVQAPYLGALLRSVYPQGRNSGGLADALAGVFQTSSASFAAALGRVVHSPREVAESYAEALELLSHRFFQPPRSIVARRPSPPQPLAEVDLDTWSERLALVLEAGQLPPLRPLLTSVGAALARSLDEDKVKEGLASVVTGAIERYIGHEARSSTLRARTTAWIAELWKEPFLATLVEFVAVHLEHLMAQERGADTSGLVQKLLDILETRYAENLKLESLAEIFHYNSAYLGKLFRSKTGEYFNTALDRVRIRHAQRLLSEGLKVYQVAELVGYKYVDYFHTKFKKYVGVSPSQYRAEP